MNPQQEITLNKVIIGALRGLIEALQGQNAGLERRASAYSLTATDTRALHKLRGLAAANGVDPGWAEQCYVRQLAQGHSGQRAFDDVVAELEAPNGPPRPLIER